MLRRLRSVGRILAPVVGLLALANVGCASTIAAKYPKLDRRAVCLLVPGVESDSTEYVFTKENVPISNFHEETVEKAAETARTVFEYDPNADPGSVRHLPAPFNNLTCPKRFRMLPSKDAETPPLPEASIDLLVHEARPEPVPQAVAEKLASCPRPSSDELDLPQYTMAFNVYVAKDGHADAALLVESTLGDRKTEACLVNALRTTVWPVAAPSVPHAAAAPLASAPLSKLFLADGPTNAPDVNDLLKQILRGVTSSEPPAGKPGAYRLPNYIVPLRLIVGVEVFIWISLWPRETAPRCLDELNPITHRPYTNTEECNEVLPLSPEEIQRRQKAAQPQPRQPPVPEEPPPPPPVPPRREPPDKCPKIYAEIHYLIYEERKKTEGDRPQGYQGLAKRWKEYATNEGKWGYTKEGKLGTKAENHLGEYIKHQGRLKQKLDTEWENNQCDDKGYALPDNTRQYAAQEPQLGPGKPLGPAPIPIHPRPSHPSVNAPQAKKPSK